MNEVAEIALPKCKTDLKFGKSLITASEYNNFRTVLSVSLPFYILDATPPRPDPSHPPSLVGGIIKRFGYEPPKPVPALLRKIKRFTALWLKHKSGLQTLADSNVMTFDEWIAGTAYSQSRKDELKALWIDRKDDMPTLTELAQVASFIKDETYPEFKFPRLINSRVDVAKCYFGPIVATISERLFALPHFIKKIPVADRPEAIFNRLYHPGATYMFTDYTAFEAHFTATIMRSIEYQLYKFMCKGLTLWEKLKCFLCKILMGTNVLKFKMIIVKIIAGRMSGEMNTSQDNGFSNLIIYLFLIRENAIEHHFIIIGPDGIEHWMFETAIFVEGDDGLAFCSEPSLYPTKEQYADLGFTIKIGLTDKLNEASFCGCVYDVQENIVVTDIREVICRLGWTNKKYVQSSNNTRQQLLKAKALSLCHQYNGCPVLSVLGRKLLSLLQNVTIEQRIIDNMDWWEKTKFMEMMAKGLPVEKVPSVDTRELVERLYNVSVHTQCVWEQLFANMKTLAPVSLPDLNPPSQWTSYFQQYSHNCYDTNPVWLVRDETSYLARLQEAAPQLGRFIRSLGVRSTNPQA